MGETKRKRRRGRYTSLQDLKKSGSKIVSSLSGHPIQELRWDRDLLPEHLWIASLATTFGIDQFHGQCGRLIDAVDEFWPSNVQFICRGLISDFGLIPEPDRPKFLQRHGGVARELFWMPIGEVLALYPECPAYWLVDGLREPHDSALDPFPVLAQLRRMTAELLKGRETFAARVRMVPFARLLKRGKIVLPEDTSSAFKLLTRYPGGLTDSERALAESTVRATMNAMFVAEDRLEANAWSKNFWRHNYDLAICKPVSRKPRPNTSPAEAIDLEALQARMASVAAMVKEYVAGLTTHVRVDLYDTRKDEILLGLFARGICLAGWFLDARDPILWTCTFLGDLA